MKVAEDEIGTPNGIDTILLEKLVRDVVKGLDCKVWTTDLGCVHVKPGGSNQDPGAFVITINWFPGEFWVNQYDPDSGTLTDHCWEPAGWSYDVDYGQQQGVGSVLKEPDLRRFLGFVRLEVAALILGPSSDHEFGWGS